MGMKELSLLFTFICVASWINSSSAFSAAEPCMVGKTAMREGEAFARSLCTTCVCHGGKLECMKPVCPPLQCGFYEDLGTYEGECCPICIPRQVVDPSANRRPASCQEEGEFTDPANPCLKCSCQNGHKMCVDIAGTCEPLSCERMVHAHGECCPQCLALVEHIEPATCRQDDGTVMESGSSFSRDSCTTCTCSNGVLFCATAMCITPECPHGQIPVTRPGECCLSCPPPPPEKCVDRSIKREGDCMRCMCINGEYECYYDTKLCPDTSVSDPSGRPREGRCVAGKTVHDGCWKCKCIRGNFQCKHDLTLCTKKETGHLSKVLRTQGSH